MKKCVPVVLLLFMFDLPTLQAQRTYWQQFVHYQMDVTLLPLQHALIGDETILYKNNSPDTLDTIYLHLYPNAYRNKNSIREQEAKKFKQDILPHVENTGYLDIESFKILNANERGGKLTAFHVNDTILKATLPQPLPPDGELTIKLSFYLKVRKFSGRAGYRGFQYDFAQWYPKVCVYDDSGWNAQPFHYLGEFYGEFGTFDVTMHVPSEYVVAATGIVTGGDPGWNMVNVDTSLTETQWRAAFQKIRTSVQRTAASGKMRTVTFHAENVHDFAWITGSDFLYESGEWNGIPIHVLYRSYMKSRWSKHVVRRAKRALSWLSTKFGRYPYPQLSVTHGLLGGGMEYPMLVMDSSESESLILHEVGHIYFYGILANNEWKEAWLDEGFTSFQTRWYLETRYGKWGYDRQKFLKQAHWLQKHRPALTRRMQDRFLALSYINSGINEPISKAAYTFHEPYSYRRNAYTKGAFFYDMLRYVVGDSTFAEICHEYFRRWKFKHVNEARFKQVCEDVSGQDLTWFFKQWLHETPSIDYALGKISKTRLDNSWKTDVHLIRKGTGKMPVDVTLTTISGNKITRRWQGQEKIGQVSFATEDKPANVQLDPQDAILDNSLFNNEKPHLQFHYDYPNLIYRPRNAYLVTWRPSVWYNNVDKAKIGLRFRGMQAFAKNLDVAAWYGTDSHVLDGRILYRSNIKNLGSRSSGTVMARKVEGRLEVDAHLNILRSKYLTIPPLHRFLMGFNHTELVGKRSHDYVTKDFDRKQDVSLPLWQDGTVNKLYLRYALNPRGQKWFTNLSFGFDTVQEDWGSDFTFTSLQSEFKFWTPKIQEGISLRLFAKKIIDNPQDTPIQELIFLDGANPRQQFNRFYLRSNGSLPEELHYQLPGGGNVRGYYNQPIAGDQILALNIEVRKRVTSLAKALGSVFGTTGVALFADVAKMEFVDSHNELFADAGLGLRFQKFLPDNWLTLLTRSRHVTLRLDFPIWINKPLADEKAFRFRWIVGLEQAI